MDTFVMTINGRPAPITDSFEVVNPATAAPFATAPSCSDAQLDEAVAAAASALAGWKRDDDGRRAALRKMADRIEAEAPTLGHLLTQEQGKPVPEATGEILQAAQWLRYYADMELADEVLMDNEFAKVVVTREAIGPVAAITPWNAPIGLAFWKIAPALRAGNTVVVKPSPFTPLTTLRIGELVADLLPAGVLNVISGPDPLGAKLSQHPGIRKISFTGSTTSGIKVAQAAAADLKRVTLELGGNDPAIVLADADLELAAATIYGSSMTNVGQICVVPKRVYVHRSRYADFVSAVVERAGRVRLGDGTQEGTTHGPLNNKLQLDRVADLVSRAVDSGATVAAGGAAVEGDGFFHEATVLTDVTDEMAIVAEEQFGPALPILVFDEVEEAVARANAGHFGLGSSVWTADLERGAEVARSIEAGTTWVNAHLYLLPELPFGGVKHSGIGTENGPWGLHEFTDKHVIYQNLVPAGPWA